MLATTKTSGVRVHIRWMIRTDLPEVLAIERACSDRPWPEERFLSFLREPSCIGMVAVAGGKVAGFMLYQLQRGQIRVHDFAVMPWFRRSGVGSRMVERLVGKLSLGGRMRLWVLARESNLDAQLFFRSRGFLAVETVRGHFTDTGEDAYLMVYALDLATIS